MRQALDEVGLRPVDLLSRRSNAYRERSAAIDAMNDEALLTAMVNEPTLIRRPLIFADGGLLMGFDREGLQALVDEREGNE